MEKFVIELTTETTNKTTGKVTEIIGYYSKGLSFGNIMEPDIKKAKVFDTKEHAEKIMKIRFSPGKKVKVIPIKK